MTLATPEGLELAEYPGEVGFLLRPVAAKLVDYSEIDGTRLDLNAFAELNEMMDVDIFNRQRIEEATRPRG